MVLGRTWEQSLWRCDWSMPFYQVRIACVSMGTAASFGNFNRKHPRWLVFQKKLKNLLAKKKKKKKNMRNRKIHFWEKYIFEKNKYFLHACDNILMFAVDRINHENRFTAQDLFHHLTVHRLRSGRCVHWYKSSTWRCLLSCNQPCYREKCLIPYELFHDSDQQRR